MATDRAKELAQNTTFELNPESQPYKPGFWAVDYDPTQAQWTDTESELGGFDVDVQGPPDVEAVMPDVRARDLHTPPGPPGEAAWRMKQQVPSILQQSPKYDKDVTPPVASALPDATDTSVEINKGQMSNWQVNAEHALQEMIKSEETDPTSRIQSIGQKPVVPAPEPQVVESEVYGEKKQTHEDYYIQKVRLGKSEYGGEGEFRKLEDKIFNIGQRRFAEFMPDAQRILDLNIIKATEYLGTHPKYVNDPGLAYGPQGYVPPNWHEDEEFIKRGLIGYDRSAAGQYITGGALGPLITTDKIRQGVDFEDDPTGEPYTVRMSYGNQPELERGTAIHEPIHHVQNVLSQTIEYWKDVEFRGQKLVDILAPVMNGKREWDRAANHIVNYANASSPSRYTRISTYYGTQVNVDGTPNSQYVELFSKAGDPDRTVTEPEKYQIADELALAVNEAARLVANAYENNPNFRLTTPPPSSDRQ